MVQCFLIHTIGPVINPNLSNPPNPTNPNPVSCLAAGESRVLYSRVFGPAESDPVPEQRRLLQREKLAVVARQVRSAASLSREAGGRVVVETVLGEEAVALQEADSGVLRLGAGDPFPGEVSVLWQGVQSLGFTLVCQPHENLLLAQGTLRTLTRHCLEQLRMLGPGSEVLLKSDRIDVLLSRLLPHGQLLFLNHRLTQVLERDVAGYLAK